MSMLFAAQELEDKTEASLQNIEKVHPERILHELARELMVGVREIFPSPELNLKWVRGDEPRGPSHPINELRVLNSLVHMSTSLADDNRRFDKPLPTANTINMEHVGVRMSLTPAELLTENLSAIFGADKSLALIRGNSQIVLPDFKSPYS